MERKIFFVFVAGGSGTRMGTDVPKQFLDLCGVPVLQRTISNFAEACPEARIVTVLPKEHFELWKNLCTEHSFTIPQTLVAGGITRFHSVRAALEKIPDGAIVAIHDGVRPLASPEMIRRLLQRMDECRAVVPAVPVVDSLKFKDGSVPEPDRNAMLAVQTPQIFRSEDLKKAYSAAYELAFTDDAAVAVRSGICVSFEEGEKYNLKITTPEDLSLAKLIVSQNLLLP